MLLRPGFGVTHFWSNRRRRQPPWSTIHRRIPRVGSRSSPPLAPWPRCGLDPGISSHHHGIGIFVATVGVAVCGNAVARVVRVTGRRVDAYLDPSEDAIAQILPEVDVLRERIVGAVSLLHAPHILSICGGILRVGVVGVCFFHGGEKHFVSEQFADVSHFAARQNCGGCYVMLWTDIAYSL